MKRILGLFLLAIGASVAMLGGGTAQAATCTVPGTHATIQFAVSDFACATINVAPGTYFESVTINRSLTLNGAQVGVDGRTRSGAESVIDGSGNANVTIMADNVTIDGFTLLGPANQGTAAVVMMGGNVREMIRNNIIENPGRAASFNTSNTTFSKNAVHATSTAGDGFQENSSPASNVSILDNSFDGATGNYNADVTILGVGSSGIVVAGNSSIGDSTLVALFHTNGAQITGNTMTGATGSAIFIGGDDSNITVSGNHITGGAYSAVRISGFFFPSLPSSAITITGNVLANNGYGVNVGSFAIAATETVLVHQNNITGNTGFGVNNDSTGAVAGTCNWWGAANGPGPVGPGSGDRVSINVTFSPWLTSPAPSPCSGAVVTSKEQCKKGGWQTLFRADGTGFKNQGDCVSYTNNGK